MKKVLLGLVALFALSGCVKHSGSIDCVGCSTHLENGASTVDCTTCTFKYDGEMRDGNIIDVSLPQLPSRP